MIAAAAVDTTVVAAFAVGFVSFISPCVLPLVPGYLSAVSRRLVAELQTGERSLRRCCCPAIVFCLSFTVVFVALGMTATGLGSTLQDHRGTLDKIAGVVIIALGVLFVLTPFVPKLNREWRPDALMHARRLGRPADRRAPRSRSPGRRASGPTLGVDPDRRRRPRTRSPGRRPAAPFYSAGLAVPFLLTAVAFNRATTRLPLAARPLPA